MNIGVALRIFCTLLSVTVTEGERYFSALGNRLKTWDMVSTPVRTRKLSEVRNDERKSEVSRREFIKDGENQRFIWVTEDRYTSNLGDELKGWTDPKLYNSLAQLAINHDVAACRC